MDRAFKSGASATPPTPPASPSIGYATAGNAGTGVPATKPGPWWFHMITEEMRNVILTAGLTPDQAATNQVQAALEQLFLRRSQYQDLIPRVVVTFNGFDGGIWYSRGVSSVTKISTGCYEINFSSPMPSANYAMVGSATESDGVTISTSNPGGNNHIAGCGLAGTVSVKTVNKMRVYCFEAAGSPATVGPEDASFISVCFIGG